MLRIPVFPGQGVSWLLYKMQRGMLFVNEAQTQGARCLQGENSGTGSKQPGQCWGASPGSTFTSPSAVSRKRATAMRRHVTWRHHPESLTKWRGGKKRGGEKWNVGETHSGRVGSGVQGPGWAGSVGGCLGDSCSQTSRTAPAADVGNPNTYI